DFRFGLEHGAGPNACKRADRAAFADHGIFDHCVRGDLGVWTNAAIFQHAVRTDLHVARDVDRAFEHDVDVDLDILCDCDIAAQIDTHRVAQRDAGEHQLRRFAL